MNRLTRLTAKDVANERLKVRKIEFLKKLKDLMSEYIVTMGVNPDDGGIYIVTNRHEVAGWESRTLINDLTEECIEDALNVLD